MAETVNKSTNYYQIAYELEQFKHRAKQLTKDDNVESFQYEMMSYIFSENELKAEFVKKVNEFINLYDTNEYRKIINKITESINTYFETFKKYKEGCVYVESSFIQANKKLLYYPKFGYYETNENLKVCYGIYNFYPANFFNMVTNEFQRRYSSLFENLNFYILTIEHKKAFIDNVDIFQKFWLASAMYLVADKLKSLFIEEFASKCYDKKFMSLIEQQKFQNIQEKYKLTNTHIQMLKLWKNTPEPTQEKVGKLMNPKINSKNFSAKLRDIKNKLSVRSIDEAISKLENEGVEF